MPPLGLTEGLNLKIINAFAAIDWRVKRDGIGSVRLNDGFY